MPTQGRAGTRLHSLVRILLGKPENAEAGAIALFRVGLAGHDAIKQFAGRRADGLGPVHQAGGRPLQVPLVRLGPVIVDRGGNVRHMAAYQFAVFDVFAGTVGFLGIAGQNLEVVLTRLKGEVRDQAMVLGVDLEVQLTDASIYAWTIYTELSPQEQPAGTRPAPAV